MTGAEFKAIAMRRASKKYRVAPNKWAEEIGYEIGYSARAMRLFATMATVPERAEKLLMSKRPSKRVDKAL